MADPRLLQANDRTMLAWTRTNIALMTFGFVIARLGVWLRALASAQGARDLQPLGTAWIGAVFVALGAIGSVKAIYRYVGNRRAIREGRGIREDNFAVLVASIVAVLGVIMGAQLLYHLV